MSDERAQQLGRSIARDIDAMQNANLTAQKNAFLQTIEKSPRRLVTAWVFVGSCALIVAVVAASMWRAAPVPFSIVGKPGSEGQSIATDDAEIPLSFNDGTSIHLAAVSSIVVREASHGAVTIRLARGRIDADVAHGTPLRWRFEAGAYSVHIVGTSLSVANDDGAISVAVIEGAVRVSGPGINGGGVSITSGQRFVGSGETHAIEPTAPAAEPAQGDHPPKQTSSKPQTKTKPSKEEDDWRRQLTRGQYDGAVATLKRLGLADVLVSASATELAQIADAARAARDPDTAKRAFAGLRERYPKSRETKRSRFLLGRIAMELEHDPRGAAKHFEAYIAEDPNGELVEEAFGRAMEALREARDTARATSVAVRYIERFPEGNYTGLAHALGAP